MGLLIPIMLIQSYCRRLTIANTQCHIYSHTTISDDSSGDIIPSSR